MKTLLLIVKKVMDKGRKSFSAIVLLLILLGITQNTYAQVYYLLNSSTGNTTNVANSLRKVDYNGSNDGVVTSSIPNPSLVEVDAPNNRIFAYSAFVGNRVINVINMTTGAVINTITLPAGIQVSGPSVTAIKYDPINDWVYYVSNSNTGTANDLNAIYRSKPDGTQNTVLAKQFALLPQWLALDIPNNRVFVNDGLFSARKMLTFDLTSNTVTASTPLVNIVNAIGYDAVTDYIYYITSDNDQLNSGTTNGTVNDALRKIRPGGAGGEVVVKSSLVISPQYMALDAGNNRAFVYNGYYGSSQTIRLSNTGIYAVDLTTGNTTLTLDHSGLQNTPNYLRVYGLFAPARPIVATASVSTFSSASATLGGDIISSDVSVTERGVVYSSTNQTPTIGGSGVTKSAIGSGNGAFSGSITGLSSSTTYYVRSYATSTAGTGYGDVVSFSTQSNDATLSGLSLSSGSLNTTFASATTSYTASVPNATTSVTVIPTRNQANATITVNGTAVTSGSASGSIGLNIGDNTVTTIVTAQDGSTTKTYTVTVNRAKTAQTITFASTASKAYGSADYAPGATSSSGLTVSYSSDNTAVATIVGGNIHLVGPGTANITASQAGDANNLAATSVVQALTVNNAAITVTATAANKIYGDADPSFTYSITSGALVGTDAFSGTLTRDAGTNIGTYNITQGTLNLGNKYTLTFVPGVLTVNKRAISIQPAPAIKSYGDNDPGGYPYYYRVGSLASTDGMTGSYVREPGETPGTYALSIGTKHPVNATTGVDQTNNYDITFIPEYLTITKRVITLHPVPATKVYGNADPTFPYQFTVGSLAPGEGMTGTFGREPGENVGTYALNLGTKRPVNATSGVFTDQYYTISIISDNLTITKKTIMVSANALSKTYGDADPALTYAADALGFSDTFSGTLTRVAGEGVGTYAISQGSLALNTTNYNLNFTGSNFTIGKKTINVTANVQTKTYGDPDPALTYTADALANGESFTGALTRAAGDAAGTYAITQGSLVLNGNYTLAFTGNNLTIGQKAINITANAQSKTYGDADPALTYTADALLGSDTFTGALTRAGGETAGDYAITLGSLTASSNYALNYTGNNLTIGKVALSYVATPVSKIYLSPNPTFTGTVTGFINGDTQASATTGTLSFTSTATDSSPQGNYPINGSGLNAANYSFIQAAANSSALTVVLSPDATLSNITVSQGTLNTPFDAGTLQYTVNVDHNTTSIDLTAVLHQANATMLVNGAALTSGLATTLPLGAGNNYFTIVITAQDGTTTQNYLVTVNRAFSTNTLLTNITLSGVTLNPVFDSNTTTYTASVGNLVDGTDATATTADVDASAQLGPVKLSATTPYHLTLNVGDNPINVDGVAQNGDIKHYYITVTRAASSDASLASLNTTVLTFNEPFSSTTYNYTATVANNVAQFNFAPVATNNAATITFNGNPVTYYGVTPTLNYGVNTYSIIVKSEDGTATNTYTITVTRTLSSDNNLSTLSIPFVTTLNEPFDPSVLNYTATLADSTITGLPLTAYSYDPNATMKINGTAVTRFANYTMTLHGGINTFNIVVTPQDNSTPKTYTLVLTRAGMPPPLYSPDASLAAISVSGTGYSYNFNFAYDVLKPLNVANKITGVRLHPVTGDVGATTTVNGVAIAYDASTDLLPLNVGDNTFDVVVTAADGVHKTTTTLHVNRLPAADVSLASLALNAGTLSPAFAGTTFTYTASVPYSFSNLNVTPVATSATATVTVGATTIGAGTPSASVPLNTGLPNRIRVTVTAADGVNTQVYTVNVTRLAPDASLASLTLSSGTLSPSFNGATTGYTASVGNNVSNVTVKPIAVDPGSVVTVNDISPDNANLVNIPLTVGANSITTIITAPDGTTTQTYTVTVTRAAANAGSSDASLTQLKVSNGTLDPVFLSSTTAYTTIVANGISNITVTPTITALQHVVTTVNGVTVSPVAIPLNIGANIINITVTAQDGTTSNTYTLTVKRAGPGSSDARLSFAMNPKVVFIPASGAANYNYAVSVAAGTGSVTITPQGINANGVITVNGNVVPSGAASSPIALNAGGVTLINLHSIAEDGVSTKTYSIAVSQNGSNDFTTGFKLTPSSVLVGAAGPANYNYTTSVAAGTSSVTITPTTIESHTVVSIGGSVVASGTASAPFPLNVSGTTTINATATAQDGTQRTYSFVVSRNGSSDVGMTYTMNPNVLFVPASGTANYNYSASVAAGTGSVIITPKASNANAVITVEGNVVPSGGASSPITLNASGVTLIHMQITAEDGITTRTYSIAVSRTGSNNFTTSFKITPSSVLVVSAGPANYNYITSVAAGASSVTITPTTTDSHTVVSIAGSVVSSGTASTPLPLNVSGPTTINATATAQDGTQRTYSFVVSRNGSNDAGMAFTMNPNVLFVTTTGTANYNSVASVAAGTSSVVITPKASNANAVITIEGNVVPSGVPCSPITLNASGATLIHMQITAEDGVTTRTYSIGVSRNGSNNFTTSFKMTPSSVFVAATGAADYNYATSVSAGAGSVTITPTTTDSHTVVRIGGSVVSSGTASAPLPLNVSGPTTINATATAQDGTQRTYSFVVSRNGSNNAGLTFTISPKVPLTVVTGTATNTNNYSASVAAGTGSVIITPKASDANAVITIEGNVVPSGVPSSPITLNASGVTLIHMQITAEDGVTTGNYNIAVSQDAALSFFAPYITVTEIAPKSNDIASTGITVHQALSPNGDGVNDFLTIDGIENYADNHLSIMNSGGQLVYETRNYGVNGNVFDGHSNKSGTLQKSGTYYYSLEYKDGLETKRKTGYIILKY
ncbi:gliding motility-associated C-terminal domain-containing protein [Mucilaginibacter pineti]|uniref:Gliding motility-associated C-terminal domain-containing protein n=1 Tax=Mucilaginibacter pineti TaxID=1391627 RepID=A0A1G7DIZ3_9SPHI|nr:cadherin-like beta sandwich domain-containing protein [Mucilaginibacter pineti]SDE51502.1 gliding motility-associated C-terminal domain-containing protein [Mucilaginibacter pineti]